VTDSSVKFSLAQSSYVARYKNGDAIKEYFIDPDDIIVTSYRQLDTAGKATLIALASRIEHIDDSRASSEQGDVVAMPKLLRIIFPQERRGVTIAYDDVKINEQVQCSFTLPKQAEVIFR
jgi:hypothetical protein